MKSKIVLFILAACMVLSFSACSTDEGKVNSAGGTQRVSKAETTDATPSHSEVLSSQSSVPIPTAEPTPKPTPEPTPESTPEPTQETVSEAPQAEGIRPEFKEAMDSYEEFMDQYVDFMKKYQDSNDLSMLADYAKFLSQYAEMSEKFDEWDEGEMSNEELAYYLDVNTRIQKKLLEIA